MIAFFRKYPQVLLFGVLATMFTSSGQTFLVSLFIPHMRSALDLNQTEIAGLYAIATITSSMMVPFLGRLIDRVQLVRFVSAAASLLALGCVILGLGRHVWMVFLGFLLIRNLGQGGLAMASSTTMARIFGSSRGKALSIANLGYPMGEAIFPMMVTAWILAFGWRSGWFLLAGLTVLVFVPAVFILLKKDPHEDIKKVFDGAAPLRDASSAESGEDHFTVRRVIRDWRFYLLIIPILVPPGFLTALFFHQGSLMEWKGWSIQAVAAAFVAFALGRGTASFFIGPFVDRYSARKLIPFANLPLAAGMACFLLGRDMWWSFAYLAGAGITTGLGMTISGALWAELYGTRYLGSIKGFQFSLVVLSTAITPPILGKLLDLHVNPQWILMTMIATALLGAFLAWLACRNDLDLVHMKKSFT